jgi:hypothetical protein
MIKTKIFLKHISPLNIGLILLLIIFALSYLLPRLKTSYYYELRPFKNPQHPGEQQSVGIHMPSLSDYTIVSENNLFHSERKIPAEKKVESQAPPLPTPEIILYGTLITDDSRIAYIEDLKAPYSTQGRGRRQLTLRKGETISGFTLQEVEANRIVMVRGQEKLTVKIHEKKKPPVQDLKPPEKHASPAQTQPVSKPKQPEPQTPPKKQLRGFEQDVFDFFEKRK